MIARLDAALARLAAHAAAEAPESLTEPDPATGEQWTAGQVWGHIAEIVPFWTGEARRIVEAPPGETPDVGRRGDQSRRLAGIERGRRVPIGDLFAEARSAVVETKRFLGRLSPGELAREGRHDRLGRVSAARLLETYVVAHLEEHAAQLDGLAAARRTP